MRTIEIELFPDSGHHFYFVPLALDGQLSPEQHQAFLDAYEVELPLRGSNPKEIISRARTTTEQTWNTAFGEYMTWLRFRLGHMDYPKKLEHKFLGGRVFGIWLAIETATGYRERGFTWEVNDFPDTSSPDYLAYLEARKNNQEPSSPYVAFEAGHLLDDAWRDLEFDLAECCNLEDIVPVDELKLKITWSRPNQGEPIGVSLIVDFGNSRTVVLGLENATKLADNSDLSRVCHPIDFSADLKDAQKRTFDFNETERLIPESWFILKEPLFQLPQFSPEQTSQDCYEYDELTHERIEISGILVKRRKRVVEREEVLARAVRKTPQMFVRLSPAAIGEEAKSAFACVDIDRMGTANLSAPKRYLWDFDSIGKEGETYWQMIPNAPQGGRTLGTVPLEGDVLLFMDKNSAILSSSLSPTQSFPPVDGDAETRPVRAPEEPDYSRADSLIWVALTLIESAWEQINTEAWRYGNHGQLQRYLKDIVVTFPPGWTRDERLLYFNAWTAARNIFYWSRFPYREGIGGFLGVVI